MICFDVYAQLDNLYGDFSATKKGLHAGNQFRTTFYNDGTFGINNRPPDIGGEWPINSAHLYLLDGNAFVGSEVIDSRGDLKHIFSEVRGAGDPKPDVVSRGDIGPAGEWWTFLPLPGFANPNNDKIAMNKWRDSWPNSWPDKWDDPIDPGWSGSWNGYFGKNVNNADEESYFVADDYANKEFQFYPDSTDSLRRGLGMRMYVRGFQWSNTLVEDGIFILYDIENIGTYSHDKMNFAYKIGNAMGQTETAFDQPGTDDDCGKFNLEEDFAYLYDYDDRGAGGYVGVGYFGGAFLESPGNYIDGIDNDNDGILGSGASITETMFDQKQLNSGDEVIIIDYSTYERTKISFPDDTLRIPYKNRMLEFWPGKIVEEDPLNLVDDNLNGLIDENKGSTVGSPPNQITRYLYTGVKYVNYFTGEGLDNPLIDERRDDNIDNDDDWHVINDDLGQDGAANTFDPGEGDGIPTNGEPHFDKTDITETDMVGLSSFTLYQWKDMPHWDDEKVWNNTRPGYLDDIMQNDNVELLWGSGYFPMIPDQIERFSMALIAGLTEDDIIINKRWFALAYDQNYNFAKAPNIPTLEAVAGDKKVVLKWDDYAEKSVDVITGEDFEGYRIYRSTDPSFKDMTPITDGQGFVSYRKPLVQFDLDNNYEGYAAIPVKGVHFWLGENTGIQNTFVDTTVKNGFKYYYAVTAYDRGSEELGIAPSECTKFLSVNQSGDIEEKGTNVVMARPEAPSAGYRDPCIDSMIAMEGTTTDGRVSHKVIIPTDVQDAHRYRIIFDEKLTTKPNNNTYRFPTTKSYSLIDLTDEDTLINKRTLFHSTDEQPILEGFQLSFHNEYDTLEVNDEKTMWNNPGIYPLKVRPYDLPKEYVLVSADYAIIFGEIGIDTSTSLTRFGNELPAIPVNFTVMNLSLNKKVKFAIWERDVVAGEEGMFTVYSASKFTDKIFFLNDALKPGFQAEMTPSIADTLQPQSGDTAYVILKKPFLSNDVFEFVMRYERIDTSKAKMDLDDIRVVPNPYIVTNAWEPLNPYSYGRGPRELHFINLPTKCTLRIFNIRGQLVNTIEHNTAAIADGTEIWNMQTKDDLDISYGIYIYHVDAGELGQKIGKFAVIK
jgi:hypothetical protein